MKGNNQCNWPDTRLHLPLAIVLSARLLTFTSSYYLLNIAARAQSPVEAFSGHNLAKSPISCVYRYFARISGCQMFYSTGTAAQVA